MARTAKTKAASEPVISESVQDAVIVEDVADATEITVQDAPVIDTPPKPPAPKPGWVVPTLLATAVSAGVGFGAAFVMQSPAPDTAAQDAAMAALSQGNADLAARVMALENATKEPPQTVDIGPLEQRIAALEQAAKELGNLDAASLSGDAAVVVAALRAEVLRLKDEQAAIVGQLESLDQKLTKRMDQMAQAAEAAQSDLTAASTALLRKAAIARLRAAVDSGAPFADVLADLPDLPAALADHAATGVPSMGDLTDSFAPAARLALAASLRAVTGEGWMDRIGTFLRVTTGARSLTAREGDDPDAVISRTEAAVMAGELTTALAELGKLPPEGQAELADWVARANLRIAAVDAITALSAE